MKRLHAVAVLSSPGKRTLSDAGRSRASNLKFVVRCSDENFLSVMAACAVSTQNKSELHLRAVDAPGSDGLQITATRLPQNASHRIWNSKHFPEVIPPDRRPGLGKCKGGKPTLSLCGSDEFRSRLHSKQDVDSFRSK